MMKKSIKENPYKPPNCWWTLNIDLEMSWRWANAMITFTHRMGFIVFINRPNHNTGTQLLLIIYSRQDGYGSSSSRKTTFIATETLTQLMYGSLSHSIAYHSYGEKAGKKRHFKRVTNKLACLFGHLEHCNKHLSIDNSWLHTHTHIYTYSVHTGMESQMLSNQDIWSKDKYEMTDWT